MCRGIDCSTRDVAAVYGLGVPLHVTLLALPVTYPVLQAHTDRAHGAGAQIVLLGKALGAQPRPATLVRLENIAVGEDHAQIVLRAHTLGPMGQLLAQSVPLDFIALLGLVHLFLVHVLHNVLLLGSKRLLFVLTPALLPSALKLCLLPHQQLTW